MIRNDKTAHQQHSTVFTKICFEFYQYLINSTYKNFLKHQLVYARSHSNYETIESCNLKLLLQKFTLLYQSNIIYYYICIAECKYNTVNFRLSATELFSLWLIRFNIIRPTFRIEWIIRFFKLKVETSIRKEFSLLQIKLSILNAVIDCSTLQMLYARQTHFTHAAVVQCTILFKIRYSGPFDLMDKTRIPPLLTMAIKC